MTGRLSRPERRALHKADALILPRPLDLSDDPRPVAAHVRHVVRLLRDPAATSPAADAVAHVTALYDRTVEATTPALPASIACRKGCAHCCTQMVVMTAPEAFYVAGQLRKRPATVAAIKEAYARSQGLTLEARLAERIFCPLLEDAACSVYAARPLGCHGFVSVDLEACLAAFTRGDEPRIPMPQSYVSALYTCRLLLKAALRLAGLSDDTFEMHAALATILSTENAEARWRGGENIFADLPGDRAPPPPQVQEDIAQMVAFVAPTV